MPAVARVGVDSAGGIIIGPGASTVLVNGSPVALLGDSITPHGDSPHNSSVIISASSTVFAEGTAVARQGDSTSCGHTISSGSSNVNAN